MMPELRNILWKEENPWVKTRMEPRKKKVRVIKIETELGGKGHNRKGKGRQAHDKERKKEADRRNSDFAR